MAIVTRSTACTRAACLRCVDGLAAGCRRRLAARSTRRISFRTPSSIHCVDWISSTRATRARSRRTLRQAVLNRIRDEARRFSRRPVPTELSDSLQAEGASPLDIAIGREGVARYEAALQRLRPVDREAIIGRLELQHDYQELALILGKPNANAARVAVTRALARLMEQLDVA